MAQGKLSARQKMINLMYLVFIAMLALNMSKEILTAFGLINERLTEANVASTERNTAFMTNLATKATEQPDQYQAVNEKASQINTLSEDFTSYLEEIKSGMMGTVPSDDTENYEVQDKPDHLDQLFFQGDRISPVGQEFIGKINAYRDGMLTVLNGDYPEISSDVEKKFSTAEVTRKKDGKKWDWLKYHFEGFPMIASLTKMTQMQADVKTTQSEILSKMLAGQQDVALSFTQYNTLLEQTKSAWYAGEKFEGGIVLGRKDPNTKPNRVELTLDGRPLTEDQYTIQNGKVMLNITAGSPGDHKIEGKLIFLQNEEEVEIEVDQTFATISKPNSAVISADKMNVVYRGVDNPMTISIPGIPDNKVSASATGLTKASGSKYMMRPGGGRTVSINARGTLPDGTGVNTTTEFRIKDIPRPVGTIRGETGNGGCVRMQRQGLEISTVGAILEDFDFDLSLNVTGFSFKVSGQPTVKVSGGRLSTQAKQALRRAKRGETVQIFDINANIANNSGYKLKKISPVCIELTN